MDFVVSQPNSTRDFELHSADRAPIRSSDDREKLGSYLHSSVLSVSWMDSDDGFEENGDIM